MKNYAIGQTRPLRRKKTKLLRRLGSMLFMGSTVVLLLLHVATWLNAQEMFELKGILIEGNRFVKKAEILERLALDPAKSLFELNLESIAMQVKAHPFVNQVSISRRLPDNLVIKIVEKKPVALVNRTDLALVDENGGVLPGFNSVELLDYPIITETGYENHETFGKILHFINFLRKNDIALYAEISELSYTPETGIFFFLQENTLPIVIGDGDFHEKCSKLSNVMRILRKNGKLAHTESIDLRFEDRVVVKSRRAA